MNYLDKIIKKIIREATSDRTGSRGSYVPPIQPGLRPFSGESLTPYTEPVSDYKSPLVQYDSYDKSWDLRRNQIKELEKTASKIQDYIKTHPYSTFSDSEGNVVNQFMFDGKKPSNVEKLAPFTEKIPFNEWVEVSENVIYESTSTEPTAGEYNAPISLGLRKWKKHNLEPYTSEIDHPTTKKHKQKTLKNNIKRTIGVWEKDPKSNSYKIDLHPAHTINEDLAVWFGTKKKPKGSKQPKGPWVNICRKVDGKHPPCGRTDTSKGAYPKCRAAGVAGKMSDSAKKAACQQKRKAEKKDTQTGKGQKPIMTSYKPRKKTNENLQNKDYLINEVIKNLKNL